MQAIVLAGGLGTRLRDAVSDLPKPMAPINGKPFLDYLLNYLRSYKVSRVVLATGYMQDKFSEHYGDKFNGIEISYSVETEPLGTGGAIQQALQQITSETALILNGDTFFEVDLAGLATAHAETHADLLLALKPMKDFSRYGIVKFDGSRITSFEEKRPVDAGYINGGAYMANRTLFDGFELPRKFSFEEDFLKPFTSDLNMHCMISDSYFIDIGIPEDYHRAQQELGKYE